MYLKELNIGYDIGKTYDDLLGVSGKQLSYDFHLFYNQHEYLIEAQGEQHYEPIKYFGDESTDEYKVIRQKEEDNQVLLINSMDKYNLDENNIDYILSKLKE